MNEETTRNIRFFHMSAPAETSVMSRIVSLCKRRGFVFPASEIYGGINGFWDFGPLGAQFKNNLRDAWWRAMVECPPLGPDGKPVSIVGLDSSIIQHPQTWVASGHVGGFADLMTDCRETKQRYRADHVMCLPISFEKSGKSETLGVLSMISGDGAAETLEKKAIKLLKKKGGGNLVPFDFTKAVPFTSLSTEQKPHVIAPDAENPGTLTEPRPFNLMFEFYAGVFQSEKKRPHLWPETAQGIFLNFKAVLDFVPRAPALRHRAGWEVVPQRSHAAQFHFPLARVRADGNGIFLPAGNLGGVA